MLVCLDIEFEKIHSIAKLLKQIEASGIIIPDQIKETSELTVYAVDTRYPGDYEPVTESDYEQAVAMADRIFRWVEVKIAMIMKNLE